MSLKGLFIDPQSNDYSASRTALIILILDIQFLIAADYLWKPFSAWASLAIIVGSVCGVYGLSTGIRAWRNRIIEHDKDGK